MWQPIETAPRDGTSIMSYPNYAVVHWNGHGWAYKYVGDGTEAEDDQWAWEYHKSTHWMPLPEPPESDNG